MGEEDKTFKVSMTREKDFVFKVDFGIEGFDFSMDEPEPVGGDTAPNASRVLAAAMGNCLTASLLFCLNKARAEVGSIETNVEGKMHRNEKGRWRISEINVEINPEINTEEFGSQYDRCYKLFEDFCIVSKSIEEGIPINVEVNPR
jgi:organic hydroperoxide reductase OsmC/OhrA